MRLSKLQKYILVKIYNFKSSLPTDFYDFYLPTKAGKPNAKSKKIVQDIVHKSLDSLVAKDLLTALGKKTAKKWFIYKVKLAKVGKKLAIQILKNRQRKLPIK